MLQATYTGFGDITADAVFKVCDQPHPLLVKNMLAACSRADLAEAYKGMKALCDMGYSAVDIITTVYRVRALRQCGQHNEVVIGTCGCLHGIF